MTILLVLPALCCTAALFVVVRRPVELCRQWELAARHADAPVVDELVAQLDRYGSFGLPAIVRLLNAESSDAVTAACRTLTARLESLRQGATEEDRADLGVIAAELTAMFGRSSEKAPRETVDFALELLSTTGHLGLADQLDVDLRSRLFAACEEVLRRTPPPLEAPPIPLAALLAPRIPPSALVVVAEPTPTPIATIVATPLPQPIAAPVQPAAPAPLTAANSAARIETPVGQTDPAVRPASLPAAGFPLKQPLEVSPADQLLRADAWKLFTALNGPHRDLATTELRRRGFSRREIELGEHLTSDDPAERRRFARELPALAVTESKPWLLKLCRDEDAEVRLIAVTIMATTNDPALQELLRNLSVDDADDEVRRTAGRATGRVLR